MLHSGPLLAVALDGGTTNTRARLLREGRVIASARRAVGVRDTVLAAGNGPLISALRSAIEEVLAFAPGERPACVVAAGMLSSEVGLEAVPHVPAPSGIEELAAGARLVRRPEVCDLPITMIPGIKTTARQGPDGWTTMDVMRGEECETIGAWLSLPEAQGRDAAFVWPGSHTKLVGVDATGRILGSHTTLAGELTQAVARHTLLAASLPAELPDAPSPEAVAEGARLVRREGLGRAGFLVRVAALNEVLGPEERAALWIGAVIADDVDHLASHSLLERGQPVWVGGRQPQRGLYARWLAAVHSGPVRPLDDSLCDRASALGALAVELRRSETVG